MTLQSSLADYAVDIADDCSPAGTPEKASQPAPVVNAWQPGHSADPASRYAGSGFAPKTFVTVAAIHAAGIALLLTIGSVIRTEPPKPTITSFDIAAPQPSEPVPPAPPQPETAPLETVVSEVPRDTPPVPQPRLQLIPTTAMAAPVLPRAAPAVVERAPAHVAPAPIVPPDFAAAQLDNPAPAYPFASRKAREEGVVILRVHVSEAGRANRIEIADSSGSPRLDRAARDTVGRWRFLPARQGGSPVSAWVLVPITFSLG